MWGWQSARRGRRTNGKRSKACATGARASLRSLHAQRSELNSCHLLQLSSILHEFITSHAGGTCCRLRGPSRRRHPVRWQPARRRGSADASVTCRSRPTAPVPCGSAQTANTSGGALGSPSAGSGHPPHHVHPGGLQACDGYLALLVQVVRHFEAREGEQGMGEHVVIALNSGLLHESGDVTVKLPAGSEAWRRSQITWRPNTAPRSASEAARSTRALPNAVSRSVAGAPGPSGGGPEVYASWNSASASPRRASRRPSRSPDRRNSVPFPTPAASATACIVTCSAPRSATSRAAAVSSRARLRWRGCPARRRPRGRGIRRRRPPGRVGRGGAHRQEAAHALAGHRDRSGADLGPGGAPLSGRRGTAARLTGPPGDPAPASLRACG